MATTNHSIPVYPVRRVPASRPFIWLADGWRDLWHHRSASLAYGLLVTVLGALILAFGSHPLFMAALCVGFLLVGPIITAGLCELSRCREEGELADFQSSLLPLRRNRGSLLHFAETLAVVAFIWFAFSGLLYMTLVGNVAPPLETSMWGNLEEQISRSQIIAYAGVGLMLAIAVFALSVVTIPMIVDRHVDASTAMRMSLLVTLRDFPAMLVWAALIAALIVFAFATSLWALVIIYPLLGHATWRAYRELVEQ